MFEVFLIREKGLMVDNVLLNFLLEYLKHKDALSDLEKDILSTIEEYINIPFDRKSAEKRISENNLRYPDIVASITSIPGIEYKSFMDLTDEGVYNSLGYQIVALAAKLELK